MRKETNKAPAQSEYEQHVAESGGDYQVSTSKYQNAVAKVLCVLAAIILWFYVVGTNTAIEEKVFSGVPVAIENLEVIESELGMSVISGYDYTVDLTLQGAKSELDRLSVEDITVYVDVGSITASGEQALEVKTSLPSGISVVKQSASLIRVYIDKSISISVPLRVEPHYSIESAYELGIPVPSVETVNVTGPAAELDKVAYALLSLDLGRINKSITATGKPILVDETGAEIESAYVKLQTGEVSVQVPVYTYKDVYLAAEYKHGFYNASNVAVKFSPESVRLKGDPDVLAEIDSVAILIDEKKVIDDGVLNANIPELENIENVSGITTVSVSIVHKNTDTRTMTVDNLVVLNPDDLDYMLESSTVDVTFRGTKQRLSLLNQNNVTATLDLGNIVDVPGLQMVPLTITITNALSSNVYEIGTYEMGVLIE
ncbi:MAG: hypothetical protein IJ428_06005 [Clostridia bacterium]|nr:hypothetical protein [Clostridia bacterium]